MYIYSAVNAQITLNGETIEPRVHSEYYTAELWVHSEFLNSETRVHSRYYNLQNVWCTQISSFRNQDAP